MKQDIQLLDQSIEHWERMMADPVGCDERGERPGASSCPLCDKYRDNNGNCNGCPIATYRKREHCLGTPYLMAACAFDEYLNHCIDELEFTHHMQVINQYNETSVYSVG
jgi:hypothetical protein